MAFNTVMKCSDGTIKKGRGQPFNPTVEHVPVDEGLVLGLWGIGHYLMRLALEQGPELCG